MINVKRAPERKVSNPIEQVLQAERRASEAVRDASARAESSLAEARRRGKALLTTTEERLHRATTRFEQRARAAREAQAADTEREVRAEIERRRATVDRHLAEFIAEAIEGYWPR